MKLRPYQRKGNACIRAEWDAGCTHVLAVAPTGAGKTVMAVDLIRETVDGGGRALFVVHLREVVNQAEDRLRAEGLHVGVIMPGHPRDPKAPVQVASVQTLVGEKARRYDIVVIDECHHYKDNTWRAAIKATRCEFVVGFSATPERKDGAPLGDLFTSLVQVSNYQPLIAAGQLVPSRVVCAAEVHDGNLSMEPSAAYLKYAKGRSAFVYTHSVAEAYAVRDRLRKARVTAEVIDDETKADSRTAYVAKFKAGQLAVIVNYGTMIEGVDAPACSAVVIGRVCKHRGLFLQMCGRAMRPQTGKRDALVVDLVGATLSHGVPDKDRDWFLHALEKVKGGTREPVLAERRNPTVQGWELVEWTAEKVEEWREKRREPRGRGNIGDPRAPEAVAAVKSGETCTAVANRLGVTSTAVCLWCKKAGVKPRLAWKCRSSEADKVDAVSRVASGAAVERLADEYGVPAERIRVWCRRAGVGYDVGPRRPVATQRVIRKALALVARGNTLQYAADKVGYQLSSVYRWCEIHGVASVRNRRGVVVEKADGTARSGFGTRLPAAVVRPALELVRKGMSLTKAASSVGISRHTLASHRDLSAAE